MRGIWVININKWKHYAIIVVAALFTASWLYIERENLPVFTTPEGPQAFYKAEIDDPKVALTFNVSWGEHRLEPVIEVLQDKKIDQATFFVSASWAEKYPDLVEKISEAGYTIGSHGYRYENYADWDDESVRRDMQRSKQVIEELTGSRPTLLRPPNGSFSQKTLELAEQQDLDLIHWSVNSQDYENPGTDAIVQTTLENTNPGEVLMFHASDSVKQTDKALPVIIDQLEQENYTFVSIEELMESAEAQSEEVE
ncbi:polysaccharide deacetylase family sporulation protein PdaB [Shouchella shacheensis]|uniref:polysaccharide deacetylase family sporulation protein PdaB n=1 Tax=Shouchella shacheensis TaxID=1649580 RepID=UPI00074028B9|nr:polysaccharide deacetylase family sporulation protein PdaB [Shouchella shacheensis]